MQTSEKITDPEMLARILFSKDPGPPCSNVLTLDGDSVIDIFEVLITIYLEGILSIMSVNKNQGKSDDEILENLDIKTLLTPLPWFKSLGFDLKVEKGYKYGSYCRVILACDKNDSQYFIDHSISKPYHFLVSRSFKNVTKIDDVYAIFANKEEVYRISFSFIKI